jgi:hypothetical protein
MVKLTSQHRLFASMRNLVLTVDALFVAVSAVKQGPDWKGMSSGFIQFKSKQFGLNVYLPVGAPMMTIVNDHPVRIILAAAMP